MKLIRNFLFIGICLAPVNSAPVDTISMVKNAISHGLTKLFATLKIVHLYRISTNKIIWRGKIGQHTVRVIHTNGMPYQFFLSDEFFYFYLNAVSADKALDVWKENQSMFQRILPHIDNTKDIEIRMCTPFCWAIWEGKDQYILWVSNEILTAPKEETEFRFSHEVAHAILKHTLSRAENYNEQRTRETQADRRAVKILGTAQGGIQFFYKRANNPILRLQRALTDRIYGPNDHPLDQKRVEYLQKWQNRHHPGPKVSVNQAKMSNTKTTEEFY